ncbi:MAG: nuclear transport factor 2 family protein [Micropepsaceae bacterium]
MRVTLLALAIFTAFSTSVPTAVAGGSAEDAVESFHNALQQGDRVAALGTLADDVKIYEQGWVEQSKAEYAAHHLDSDIKFSKSVKEATTAVDVSDDEALAVVMRQSTTKGTFEGKPVDSVGLETMVLRKIGGDWKIVHIHWSSRKAK